MGGVGLSWPLCYTAIQDLASRSFGRSETKSMHDEFMLRIQIFEEHDLLLVQDYTKGGLPLNCGVCFFEDDCFFPFEFLTYFKVTSEYLTGSNKMTRRTLAALVQRSMLAVTKIMISNNQNGPL
uniref:Uncharacterized protein n=1 Tax=Ixodes ricinus TaxID=34613 RepID=A0A0K8RI70_IXORI